MPRFTQNEDGTITDNETGLTWTKETQANEDYAALLARAEAAEKALEIEGMRLVACDVIAMADTPESAAEARNMSPEYRSAALESVERRVDECIRLRTELSALRESMRWIPVSERLPKNCTDVLVFREEHGSCWRDIASLDNGWFGSITHWMTLPAPPQEQD